jgi:hypothetical protein
MEDRMIGTTRAWRRARTLVPVICLAGGLVGMAACNDDDINVPVAGVITFKDSTFNFTTLHTFAMPDTVIHFNPVTGTPLAVSREFDATILSQVRQNFLSRGYTQIARPDITRPDFEVLVGVTATTNFNAFVSFSWFSLWGSKPVWGWFTPGFDNSWGFFFPWAVAVGPTAFDRGTLIVTLVPTSSIDVVNKTFRPAWAGVATALLNSDIGIPITATTISLAIDQMFVLSPYLTASAPLVSRAP